MQIPQWSFKVYPDDDNYKDRHDKTNDFFDFDPDQNWQIERHYQDCVSKSKKFGEKHIIIGDINGQKNDWNYAVWGLTADVNTWNEQNITHIGSKLRQLSRRIIEKDEIKVLEEREKSQELS